MVEVALLHARALRDFFTQGRGDRGIHSSDMLAADYIQPPESWTSPEFEYLTDERERLNRALAHLAYDRTEYAVLGTDWDFKKINDEVEAAWRAFMADLTDKRRAWFDPPTDEP